MSFFVHTGNIDNKKDLTVLPAPKQKFEDVAEKFLKAPTINEELKLLGAISTMSIPPVITQRWDIQSPGRGYSGSVRKDSDLGKQLNLYYKVFPPDAKRDFYKLSPELYDIESKHYYKAVLSIGYSSRSEGYTEYWKITHIPTGFMKQVDKLKLKASKKAIQPLIFSTAQEAITEVDKIMNEKPLIKVDNFTHPILKYMRSF